MRSLGGAVRGAGAQPSSSFRYLESAFKKIVIIVTMIVIIVFILIVLIIIATSILVRNKYTSNNKTNN